MTMWLERILGRLTYAERKIEQTKTRIPAKKSRLRTKGLARECPEFQSGLVLVFPERER